MLALLTSFALAADLPPVPVYKWTKGEVVKYHLETEVTMPAGILLAAARNVSARTGAVKTVIDTECTAGPVGKNWELTCHIAYGRFTGVAWPAEQTRVDAILTEWSANLLSTTVVMLLSADGRLKEFDTKQSQGQTSREREIQEVQRTWLMRTYSAFDLPLTKDYKDWIRGWLQPGVVHVFDYPSSSGTVASVEYTHKFAGERDGYSVIASSGRGMVSPGQAVDSAGVNLIDTRAAGDALFDVANGKLAYRGYQLDGRHTASSTAGSNDAVIFVSAAMQVVDHFEPNGEAPLPFSVQKAVTYDNPPPELTPGLELVTFDALGMKPLYINGQPDNAKLLELPNATVTARVFVDATGVPTAVTAYKGYEVLVESTVAALRSSRFPARANAYAVDVEVEIRK